MKNIKPLIGFSIIIDAILFDQLSKWLILEHILKGHMNAKPYNLLEWLSQGERLDFISIPYLPFFNLTMVWNEGISFGMLQSGDNPWPLIIISIAVCALFTVWLVRSQNWWEVIALSFVIGGAIGNVIDRLRFGAVADFFDFHWAGVHFPAFNLADSFISIGIVMLLGYSLFSQHDRKESK